MPEIILVIIREHVTRTYNNIIICVYQIPTRVYVYFEDFLKEITMCIPTVLIALNA